MSERVYKLYDDFLEVIEAINYEETRDIIDREYDIVDECKQILNSVKKEGLKYEFFRLVLDERGVIWTYRDIEFITKYIGILRNLKGEYFMKNEFIKIIPTKTGDIVIKKRLIPEEEYTSDLLVDLV